MVLVQMDPKDVLKALEGHSNALAPEVAAHEQYFKTLSCVRCGGEVYAFVDPSRLYKPGAMLPSYLARCRACGCEFEPYTKIEVRTPRNVVPPEEG